jgi:FkbM family methyltransferase
MAGRVGSLRCQLAVLPGEGASAEELLCSLEAAQGLGLGDFARIEQTAPRGNPRTALESAIDAALAQNVDWLLVLSAAETLAPDIFVKTQPALRVYDCVWGGAALATSDGTKPKLERITRLAAQDLATLFHAALRWWIGPAHFVRPAAAREALRAADTTAWYAAYMVGLWKMGGAYKTAQCLTHFHAPLPALAEDDRAFLIRHLEAEPAFMPLRYGGRVGWVPYTGLNPVIEREQMRGLFFEHEELVFLAEKLPRGLRIVDVGANTGNHTLFFGALMEAEIVIPIEPLPRAVSAIRAMVRENRLSNVDLSLLGCALGSGRGALRPVLSQTAGLGATHFEVDASGFVPVAPLDELITGRVDFIKIDAEGMEMQVLAGAAGTIAVQHPLLYVEVVDEGVREFMQWVDGNGYRVEKLFPDKTHCNYLLLPKHKPKGWRE